MKNLITPEENAELTRLRAELIEAYQRAADAIGADADGKRFAEEDAKGGAIVRRIRKILGIEGQHWSA